MLAHPSRSECDRFIPSRSYNKNYHPDACSSLNNRTPDSIYSHLIKKQLFENIPGKIINFDEKVTKEYECHSEASSTYFK